MSLGEHGIFCCCLVDVSNAINVITYSYLIFFDNVGVKLSDYNLSSLATEPLEEL